MRTARAEDKPEVLRVWAVAIGSGASREDESALVDRLLAHDPGALLVAQLGDSIVGTAIAAWDGWRGHIYRLAVTPAQRRRGLGSRLVVVSHERLRALGATRVNAAVSDRDSGPVEFWLSVGYRRDTGMSRFALTL